MAGEDSGGAPDKHLTSVEELDSTCSGLKNVIYVTSLCENAILDVNDDGRF